MPWFAEMISLRGIGAGRSSLRFVSQATAIVIFSGAAVFGSDPGERPDEEAVVFFEKKIRPVLVERCYRCHSAEAGKMEGSLRLDTKEGMLAGGDRGLAIVPGDPDASLLLTAISHSDPDFKMPPKGDRLPDSVIRDFRIWIESGAADPRSGEPPRVRVPAIDLEAGREFWSFKRPVHHVPPPVETSGWAKRDLDYFILAKLEAAGLAPTADAAPATLLRRLHFDLVGLPPSPEAIDRFHGRIAAMGLDAAIASEVDELLESERFGERWGRHWLDVARFAESSGKDANISFPYAFRYRDYVIDALNADMPFDRFLVEQIAGDLLPAHDDKERARLLIATGFLAVGPKNLEESNSLQFAADVIDEQIDAVSRAILANSIACARCHDHKFDPFSMEDYYALAGIFASTETYFGTAVSPANRRGGDPLPLPLGANEPIFHASISPERVEKLKQELATLKAAKPTTLREALGNFWRSGAIEGQLEKVDQNGNALPLAMGVTEAEHIVDVPLLERGEITRPTTVVPRGFPRVIEISSASTIPPDQSGRVELAKWLTDRENPLTARVLVNRVWHHLFGAGIVRSVDNFGFTGDEPSHPELLDELAVDFMENGWSIKAIIREMVLSRTYRQASTYDESSFTVDPENRLLWRASKRRLDAEVIRDAMLVASGELDTARPAGSLVARVIGDGPISLIGLNPRLPKDLDGSRHRSVYLPVLRDRLPDILDLFDFAEPSLVTGDRETTNVPVQALYLMNSPFVQERATGLAGRLEKEATTDADRVRRAFLLCLGREPDETEFELAMSFLNDQAVQDDDARRDRLTAFCQSLLATAEFRNLD